MAPRCTVCSHAESEAINIALVADGASLRDIAGQYQLSKSAVERHKAEHLPSIMVKSKQAGDIAQAEHLLTEANRLYRVATTIMDKNLAKKPETALRAVQAAGRILELLGELMGEINRNPSVNILVAPQWLTVRTALLQALAPYPDARAAVASALVEVDHA